MTKLRPIGSRHEAIDRVAGLIGYTDAAEAIGKSENYLRQCSDPDNAREITAHDAQQLDRLCKQEAGQTPFADWLARKNGEVDWTGPRIDLNDALLGLSVAQGQLIEAIRAAKAPTGPGGKRITMSERANIVRKIQEVQRPLNELISEVDADAQTNITLVG